MTHNPGDPDAAGVSAEMSEGYDESVEAVGRDDAAADAARSGVDPDPESYDYDLGPAGLGGEDGESRDTDGVPVGTADADADAARTGGDR